MAVFFCAVCVLSLGIAYDSLPLGPKLVLYYSRISRLLNTAKQRSWWQGWREYPSHVKCKYTYYNYITISCTHYNYVIINVHMLIISPSFLCNTAILLSVVTSINMRHFRGTIAKRTKHNGFLKYDFLILLIIIKIYLHTLQK